MGVAVFPASGGGLTSAIKSLQRGVASGAGNITITSVDTAKTICNSFSTSSAGSVAATGTISAANGSASATSTSSATLALTYGQDSNAPQNMQQGAAPRLMQTRTCNWNSQQMSFANNTSTLGAQNISAQNVSLNTTSISGGSTSLTTAVYGVYLVNSTTITATGPCRYEVIEYF